jgi:bifunctional DNA-binding transcriptional regulator/antitoxin component of YhaV-PrlF toxin-antitoxin module
MRRVKTLSKPVLMDPSGRLTMPAEARRELRLEGEIQFVVEVGEGEIVLRPAVTIAREDAWAHTPEHRELLSRALEDVRRGRVVKGGSERQLSKEKP